MVTLVLYKHKAVKVWSTYFPPNKLRNLDINMASTAHGGTKVLFGTTCDMCRFSFDLSYCAHLKKKNVTTFSNNNQ